MLQLNGRGPDDCMINFTRVVSLRNDERRWTIREGVHISVEKFQTLNLGGHTVIKYQPDVKQG